MSSAQVRNLRDKFMKDNQKMIFSKSNKGHIDDESKMSAVKLKECVVCMSGGPADGVIMPCGHSGICYACAVQMLEKEQTQCHLCREDIE